jgi:DnaK suppressor protein
MLTSTQQARFRERLVAERARLLGSVQTLDTEVQQFATNEDIEHATLGNHQADGGSELYEQEQLLTLEQNERDIISRIDHALARLDEGVYGTCENCGQPISVERLEVLPYATLCIRCQAAAEEGA